MKTIQTLPPLERRILLGILATFALLGALYSVTVPLFEMSDEVWHYPMVEVIARTWTLPVQPLEPGASSGPWRQEGSQPPLYYALGAGLTFWIDTSDLEQVRHLNPHVAAGEITPDRSNPNLVAHRPGAERFPWRGTVLAVRIVRLFSVALGVWAVYLTWALVRELYPEPTWLPLAAAAIHAFTPMYLFISASVNNDNLIVPLCSLALLWMLRMVKSPPETVRPVDYAKVGVVIALATLTKASGLGLLPFVAATIAWQMWQRVRGDGKGVMGNLLRHLPFAIRNLLIVLLPMVVLAGWWFARNVQLYGDWLGFNAFYAVLGTRDVPADFAQLWAERFAFAAGYWGNFGGLNAPMPTWIYRVLNTLAVLAMAGLLLAFLRWLLDRDAGSLQAKLWPFSWNPETAARALAWAWPVAILVSWMQWAAVTWSSQGRLIFSAIPLWSLGLALGVSAWLPQRARPVTAGGFAALLLSLSAVALPAWILPLYAPPPIMSLPSAIIRHEAQFGETLRLHGYTLASDRVRPGQPVEFTLYWEALAPTSTDHSIFIHLRGAGERIVAQRDAFPGRGLVSTTWLEPGATWAERYVIPISRLAFAPDPLTFAVGVVETYTGQRLPVTGDGHVGEFTTFSGPELRGIGEDASLDVRFGKGMTLIGYHLSAPVVGVGETLTLTLFWRGDAPIDGDYTISVQLIDDRWNKAAQSDTWPLDGAAPTSTWEPGQVLREIRALPIAPDAEAGFYDLRLAVYRAGEDGELEHRPITWEYGQMPVKSVTLTRVRVQ